MLEFLADRKESEELVMVVDEELKMMSSVCPGGGVMTGPFLKPMSRVAHTEYLLEGQSDLDVRDVLRLTMFAPTVTGSPMESSCEVIARYEDTGRGYYSGVLAHFHNGKTGWELDAPIMIRTAEINPQGNVRISAGATLVRHSDAAGEALETRVKASGMLSALGLLDARRAATQQQHLMRNSAVEEALESRNKDLAPFWRDAQSLVQSAPERGSAVVVNMGDQFSAMLGHQLRHLGFAVEVLPWDEVPDDVSTDLLVFGPGPGNPTDLQEPRLRRVQDLMRQRLDSGQPVIAEGLSHQLLAQLAGVGVQKLDQSRQGEPKVVELLGQPVLIGFYDTFAPVLTNQEPLGLGLEALVEPDTAVVQQLTGDAVVSVQGHLESVLSLDGYDTLKRAVEKVFADTAPGPDSSAVTG